MRDETVLFEALEIFWRNHVPPSSRICVAVSGGADSVALFHLCALLRRRLSVKKIGIAHVNHCLRGSESDGDARFVEAIAKKADVPFHCTRLSRKKIPARGIEAWARERRYAFFASVMKRHGYDFMATAHTADDQAETILLRLLRGSGIRGLSGIAPVREDRIIRPLLTVQKETLIKWLICRDHRFREDSSNKNTDFTRNWVRHRFLPVFAKKEPDYVQLLTTVANKAAAIERIMRPQINKWLNRYVVKSGKVFFSVDKNGFDDDTIAGESLISLLRDRRVEFDRFHVESIAKNKDKIGKTFLLPSGWRYRPTRETVEFFKKEKGRQKSSFSYRLKIRATTKCGTPKAVFTVEKFRRTALTAISFSDPMIAFLDAQKMEGKGPMVFRSVLPHEKFWPYGAGGHVEVNEFLKKQKLLKYERMRRGVVSLGKNKEILWVVGMRISDRFKITPQTKEILKISYEPG